MRFPIATLAQRPALDISVTATAERKRSFHTLDALRGIAALLIVTRHVSLFGGVSFTESYLAVDLFFVMSGVVLAHSYEGRLLAGESPWTFLARRYIRLYPLYLIGLALGAIAMIAEVHHKVPIRSEIIAIILGLLMLPSFGFPAVNAPRWSLTYEIIVNAIYGFFVRRLSTKVMSGCVALSAVILTIAVNRHGGFDFGWQADLFYAGIARVVFSFFFGVILMRKFSMHRSKSSIAAWLCVVAVGAVLALSIPASFKVAYELLTVFVIFPAIVLLAMRFDVDASTARVFTFLGVTSYAVYVLHAPAGLLFFALTTNRLHLPPVYGSILFLGLLVVGCWLLDRYYDRPLRKFLQRRLEG